MTAPDIERAIPHRPPMLLVDSIESQTDRTIRCRKTFHADEYFFQGHYPGFPIVPGVILCESGMQAGAILLSRLAGTGNDSVGSETAGRDVPVATRLNDVKFKRMIRPGETVQLDVELNERLADTFFLTARVSCEGKLAVRFDFACTLARVNERVADA